jgi:hypothetical protein
MPKQKIAMLTAGGLAPCLSSAVAELIGRDSELVPDVEMISYLGGYRGLLKGESVAVTVPRPRNTDDLLVEASTSRPVARCHRITVLRPTCRHLARFDSYPPHLPSCVERQTSSRHVRHFGSGAPTSALFASAPSLSTPTQLHLC